MLEMYTSGQINDIHVDEVIKKLDKANRDPRPIDKLDNENYSEWMDYYD